MSGEIQVAGDMRIARDPVAVLEEARRAADALMLVVSKKQNPVRFNSQQYLEYEDWQTVGKFYGITAKNTGATFVDYGGAKGFEAGADAVDSEGRVISHADAMCLNDEDNWSTRPKYEYREVGGKKTKVKIADIPVPMFQLKSMAQTRAAAKCLRNVLAWVVVLAGFPATPAEEMTGTEAAKDEPLKKPVMDYAALAKADFKQMPSKFKGQCKACEKEIPAGAIIMYNKTLGVFHPECLKPPVEEKKVSTVSGEVTPQIIKNLEKFAEAAGVKLLDRIGRDGHEKVDELSRQYINDLLAEFAEIVDAKAKEDK